MSETNYILGLESPPPAYDYTFPAPRNPMSLPTETNASFDISSLRPLSPTTSRILEGLDSDPIEPPAFLNTFNTTGHWSGKGQHVEFDRKEPIPLVEGRSLGRGASADVHEVVCQGVTLARKQIYCSRRMKLEDVRRELDILKKISHRHVVTLVGSYIQSKILGLLLFPAAVCDLGMFLDEYDEALRTQSVENTDTFGQMLQQLDMTRNMVCARLKKAYGCLANGVAYLHDNDIRHKDLKPRNILLDRHDKLFITDFGISRDNTDASTSITSGIQRGTYKYCAPEVARFEPRGRAADVYSLGCIFLEICTVYHGLSIVEFDEFRTEDGDYSFQNSQPKLRDWMSKIRGAQTPQYRAHEVFDVIDLIEKMLAESAKDRPIISTIASTLARLDLLSESEEPYFGDCCQIDLPPRNILQKYNQLDKKYTKVAEDFAAQKTTLHELTKKYNKVKQLYSDVHFKLNDRTSDLNNLVEKLAAYHNIKFLDSDTDDVKFIAVLNDLSTRQNIKSARSSHISPSSSGLSFLSNDPTKSVTTFSGPVLTYSGMGYGSAPGWEDNNFRPRSPPFHTK